MSNPTFEASKVYPKANGSRSLEECCRDLSLNADHFLQKFPLQPESYTFQYDYALIDGSLIYSFRFFADGSPMVVGVVRVLYVDFETMSVPS